MDGSRESVISDEQLIALFSESKKEGVRHAAAFISSLPEGVFGGGK